MMLQAFILSSLGDGDRRMAGAQEFMASLGSTVGKMVLSSLTSFQSAGTRHTCELGTSHQSVVKPFMDWPEIQMIQRNFLKSQRIRTLYPSVDPFTGITREDSEHQVSACGLSCVRASSQCLSSTQKPSLFSLGHNFFFLLCAETNSGKKYIPSKGLPGFRN